MGCDESVPDQGKMQQAANPIVCEPVFYELKLQRLLTPNMVWENELERQIFMAINILRAESAIYT
jgi:hypothetical protein